MNEVAGLGIDSNSESLSGSSVLASERLRVSTSSPSPIFDPNSITELRDISSDPNSSREVSEVPRLQRESLLPSSASSFSRSPSSPSNSSTSFPGWTFPTSSFSSSSRTPHTSLTSPPAVHIRQLVQKPPTPPPPPTYADHIHDATYTFPPHSSTSIVYGNGLGGIELQPLTELTSNSIELIPLSANPNDLARTDYNYADIPPPGDPPRSPISSPPPAAARAVPSTQRRPLRARLAAASQLRATAARLPLYSRTNPTPRSQRQNKKRKCSLNIFKGLWGPCCVLFLILAALGSFIGGLIAHHLKYPERNDGVNNNLYHDYDTSVHVEPQWTNWYSPLEEYESSIDWLDEFLFQDPLKDMMEATMSVETEDMERQVGEIMSLGA